MNLKALIGKAGLLWWSCLTSLNQSSTTSRPYSSTPLEKYRCIVAFDPSLHSRLSKAIKPFTSSRKVGHIYRTGSQFNVCVGFQDPSTLLKHELAYCLGQMKNAAALSTLESVLKNEEEDPMVRHEVSFILEVP